MKSIKQIVVTGDIFRTSSDSQLPSVQNQNISWLYQLIRPALKITTDIPVTPLYFTGDDNCLATRLYSSNRYERTFETWVKIFNTQPTARDLSIIERNLDDALVIGFEMNEFLRNALDSLNTPYIDFTIHPVRFMDDLNFGVRSNLIRLSDVLQSWVVKEEEIRVHAGLAMSTLSRLPPIPQCQGAEQAALFCGQTTDDKVLIQDGRLLNFEDLIEQFDDMCSQHERVFVKPHPMSANNLVVETLTRIFPNTELINENFYHLLAQVGISTVYSITSSTSIEAAYFEKTGKHLASYPYVFSDSYLSKSAYLNIYPEIYEAEFWYQVLSVTDAEINSLRPVISIRKSENRIRRSLRTYWGADIFYNTSEMRV